MKEKNRRQALKVLAVGAPAVWAKPIVDSIVLPVHAETSCVGGCYQDIGEGSWYWDQPNGMVHAYPTNDCTGESEYTSLVVVGGTLGEASAILECGGDPTSFDMYTNFDGPCVVWYCD